MPTPDENPFEVLQLPPTAGEEQVVRQAARLSQLAADEPTRSRYRQAVQQLTGSPEARVLAGLLTHPRPEYASDVVDRFIAAHRRAPAVPPGRQELPGVDLGELRQLLLATILQEELAFTPLPLEAVEPRESGAEVDRQTAEALWQLLIADMRA